MEQFCLLINMMEENRSAVFRILRFNKGSERIITINRFHGNITSTIQQNADFEIRE